MKTPFIVATCLSFVITAAASAQDVGGVTERVYSSSGFAPSRSVERRSMSGGRELVVVTEELLGPDRRWIPVEEIVTETATNAGGTGRTSRSVFGFDADRRRVLRERTETTSEPPVNGIGRSVEDTWAIDINGRVALASRRIEELNTVDSDVRRVTSTLLTRGPDGLLRDNERTIHTERRIEPSLVRHETAQSLRDPNGGWMPIASLTADVRSIGPAERSEEETVYRPDPNGRLTPSERIVTRRSESDGREQLTIETYSQHAEGFVRTDGRLALSQRVRRTTTATADGGRSIVEEVEARSRVAPGDPLRVVQRTVVTDRNVGPDRRVTKRQLFELDVNGRLAPVLSETEESAAK